jgi:hypothetical protein
VIKRGVEGERVGEGVGRWSFGTVCGPAFCREEMSVNFNEIRGMAKGLGVNTYRMRKTDVIHAIQRAEGNPDCFGSPRVDACGEDRCLWREDCVSLKNPKE